MLPLNTQSVLYIVIIKEIYLRVVSRGTYDLVDWTFTPILAHPSDLHISNGWILHLSSGFNLARHRSTGFRCSTNDSRRAHPVPHRISGCGPFGFPSASEFNSLTSPLIQNSRALFETPRMVLCSYLRFHYRSCSRLVSGSFHIPLKILFSFITLYLSTIGLVVVFRIGSLCLPYSRTDIQRTVLRIHPWSYHVHIRVFHPLWCAIPGDAYFHDLDC